MTQYPWAGAFTSREEVGAYLSGARITCLLCGGAYKSLSIHIGRSHAESLDDYRARFGIPQMSALEVADMHSTRSEIAMVPHRRARFLSVRQPSLRTRRRKPAPSWLTVERKALARQAQLTTHKYTDADFTEFGERMIAGRSVRSIERDPDMPTRGHFFRWRVRRAAT